MYECWVYILFCYNYHVFLIDSIIGPFLHDPVLERVNLTWQLNAVLLGVEIPKMNFQHDHVEYQRIQNKCTMPWFRWESLRQPLSGLRNRAIWIWQRPWQSWRWSNSLGGNGGKDVEMYHQVQIMLLVIIGWDAPPLSSSHHQDYPIFRRSRTRPSLGTVASQVICRTMVLLCVKLVFVKI